MMSNGNLKERQAGRPRRPQRTSMASPLAVAMTVASAAAVTSAEEVSSASSSPRRQQRQHQQQQYLLRHNDNDHHHRRRAQARVDTNDDEHTLIPLLPFALKLSRISPASPLAIAKSTVDDATIGLEQVDLMVDAIEGIGARAFNFSAIYGERFMELNLGEAWSSEFSMPCTLPLADGSRIDDNAEEGNNAESSTATTTATDPLFNRRGRRGLQEESTESLLNAAKELLGTTILTLGHNSTATFSGAYWVDDPTSQQLTSFLLQQLTLEDNKQELLRELRPLVCSAEEMAGGECGVEIDLLLLPGREDADAVGGVGTADDDTAGGSADGTNVQDDLAGREGADGARDDVVSQTQAEADSTSSAAQGQEQSGGAQVDDVSKTESTSGGGSDADDTAAADPNGGAVNGEPASVNPGENTAKDEANDAEPAVLVINFGDAGGNGKVTGDTTAAAAAAAAEANNPAPVIGNSLMGPDPNQGNLVSTNSREGSTMTPIIIGAVAGVAILAFLIAGLLYKKKKRNNSNSNNKRRRSPVGEANDGLLKANKSDEESNPHDGEDDRNWTNEAYDSIVAPKDNGIINSNFGNKSTRSKMAATAAAATAATAATTNIDKLLENEDFYCSDGEDSSSFNSSYMSEQSSIATGMDSTGIAGAGSSIMTSLAGPLPLETKTLSKYSTDSTSNIRIGSTLPPMIDVSNNGYSSDSKSGYLPKSLQKVSSSKNKQHRSLNSSMQKQEEFEGTYRTRSAMAKLNLKKDILHVPDDTHNNDDVNGNNDHGIARTISPKKSISLVEKQRLAEKLSLGNSIVRNNNKALNNYGPNHGKKNKLGSSSSSKKQQQQQHQKLPSNIEEEYQQYEKERKEQERKRTLKEEKSAAKNLILPVGFHRSDSVGDLGAKDGGGVYDEYLGDDESRDLV